MAPTELGKTNFDTVSEKSDPVPNPPIYSRPHRESYVTRAGIKEWMATAVDMKDDPMEVDLDSSVNDDSSPPAPVEHPTPRILLVEEAFHPQPKTASGNIQGPQVLNDSVLIDDASILAIPVDDPWASMKDDWRLEPRLSPNVPYQILPLEENEQVDLEEWLDVEKLRKDGHLEEGTIEDFGAASAVVQHPEEEKVGEVLRSVEIADDYYADEVSPGSQYYQENRLAQERLQPIKNEVDEHTLQPAACFGLGPDELMPSIETDDYDANQPACGSEATEEETQAKTNDNYNDTQLLADDPFTPAHNLDAVDLVPNLTNDTMARITSGADPATVLTLPNDRQIFLTSERETSGSRRDYSKAVPSEPQPQGDAETLELALSNLHKCFDWQKKTDSNQGCIDERAEYGRSIAKQYEALRRHTPEHQNMVPEFAGAVEEHHRQLNPDDYHLPDEVPAKVQLARPQLQPAIWAEGVTSDVQLVGNSQFDDDADQQGMQPDELQAAILRGDFDDILDENCGDELNAFNEHVPMERLDPDSQQFFTLPSYDPFAGPPPVTDDGGQIQSDGGGSPAVAFQPRLLNGLELRPDEDESIDQINGHYDSVKLFPVFDEAQQAVNEYIPCVNNGEEGGTNPHTWIQNFREFVRPGEYLYSNQDMPNGSLSHFQSPSLVDQTIKEDPRKHKGYTNAEFLNAGREFLERREAIISGRLSPDGKFDAIFDGTILSREVKQWLAQKQENRLRDQRSLAISLSCASMNEQKERESEIWNTVGVDEGDFHTEPSSPSDLILEACPLGDRPTDFELTDDEFYALVEASEFETNPDSSKNSFSASHTSKTTIVQTEASTSPVGDMNLEKSIFIDSSIFAQPLACPKIVPESNIRVSSGDAEGTIESHLSSPSEDADVEMALDKATGRNHELLPSLEKTTVFEAESQVASTSEKTVPLADSTSSKSVPEPDTPVDFIVSPSKDVEGITQDAIMPEADLSVKSMVVTSRASSRPVVGPSGVRNPTFSLSFKKPIENSLSDNTAMDHNSDDEVDMIKTSPVGPALFVRPAPTSALAPARFPGPSSSFTHALPAKPPNPAGNLEHLKRNYRPQGFKDVSAKMITQRVEQCGKYRHRDIVSLQGPAESDHSVGNALHNRSQPPAILVSPQNSYKIPLGRGSGFQGSDRYSQFRVEQAPHSPHKVQAPFNRNSGFAPRMAMSIPQYPKVTHGPNLEQDSCGYPDMTSVHRPSYGPAQAGGHLGGKGYGREGRGREGGGRSGGRVGQGDSRGDQASREGWMTSSSLDDQTAGGRPTQTNSNTLSLGSFSFNSFAQGSSMLMSSPDVSCSQATDRNDSPTIKARHSDRPDMTRHLRGERSRCPKGFQQQPSHSSVKLPPLTFQQDSFFHDVPKKFSSQLPSKPPATPKIYPQKSMSPHKSAGELYIAAFAKPENYQIALAVLKKAKQREGKSIEISEDFDCRNGQTIRVTGPLGSQVRKWVIDLVPYGKQVESRIF